MSEKKVKSWDSKETGLSWVSVTSLLISTHPFQIFERNSSRSWIWTLYIYLVNNLVSYLVSTTLHRVNVHNLASRRTAPSSSKPQTKFLFIERKPWTNLFSLTVGPNSKNPPKIRFKNSWLMPAVVWQILKYQVYAMTRNGNYVNLLTLSRKNLWHSFRWIYYWRVSAI